MTIILPQTLTLAGKVTADRRHGRQRTASAAGTILAIKVPSGAFARKGDTILAITGLDYTEAQTALIEGYKGKFASKPISVEDVGLKIRGLYRRLQELKFSGQQVNTIRDTGSLYDPVPVLMPRDGIVVHAAQVGCSFREAETLFTFFSTSIVSAPIATGYADYLRAKKEFTVEFADGVARTGILDSVSVDVRDNSREVSIIVPDHGLAVGEEVTCHVQFLAWEQIHPTATATHWPYKYEARGSALAEVLGKLGVAVPPPALRPRKEIASGNAARAANPFSSMGKTDNRPARSASAPLNSQLLPVQQQNLKRSSLPISNEEFTTRRFTTLQATRTDLTRQWSLWSEAVSIKTNEAAYRIVAGHDGIFEPTRRRRNDLLQAGMVVGSIVRAPASSVRHSGNSASGLVVNDAGVTREQTLIYANQDGILLCDINERRDVTQGDLLAEVRPINMYLLRATLSIEKFRELPRIVEAHLPKVATPYKNDASLIVERSRTADSVIFDITVPAAAGQFSTGHCLEVILVDPNPRRNVLSLPRDCVVRIGASTEVMVHSEIGKLTPVPIRCGQRYGDKIEVLAGLEEGHWVVRDLDALCGYPDVGAIMAGFWDPRP